MEREYAQIHPKQDFFPQNKILFQLLLLVIVAPILKVVMGLLQTFHLDAFDMVQILNDCMCIT